MKFKIHFKMRTLILLVLVPSLSILTAVMAWIIYTDLYGIILHGFDQKLFAVSTATSSFVKGEDHSDITEMIQIRGLAYNPSSDTLYANSFPSSHLLAITVNSKKIKQTALKGLNALEDITYAQNENAVYGIELEKKQVVKIDLETGNGTVFCNLGFECYGIAYDNDSDSFFCNDAGLIKIDRKTCKVEKIGPIGFESVRGLTYNNHDKNIYGIDTDTNQLIKIDNKTGRGHLIAGLKYGFNKKAPLNFGCFGLAYDSKRKVLYGSTTAFLMKIDPKNSLVNRIIYNDKRNKKKEDLYIHYVEHMQKTRAKLNLTYLFTFILVNKAKNLYYTLDSTQDSFHSYVGYIDPDEAEDKIKDVWFKGNPYLSDINYWEEWGLLKSAYTPIYDKDDNIVAVAGADVNISIIEKKTRKALIRIIIIGIFSLLIGIVVSFFISRRLIRPIEKFKDVALKVAAGMFGKKVEVREIKEFKELSNSFNNMSSSLKVTLKELKEHNEVIESSRRKKEIIKILLNNIESKPYPDNNIFSQRWLSEILSCNDSSGYLFSDKKILLWLAESPDDLFQSVRTRYNIHVVLTKLFEQYKDNPNDFFGRIEFLFSGYIYCYIFLEPETGNAKFIINKPVYVVIGKGNNEYQKIKIDASNYVLNIKKEQVLIISSDENLETLMKSEELKNISEDNKGSAKKIISELGNILAQDSHDGTKMLAVMSK